MICKVACLLSLLCAQVPGLPQQGADPQPQALVTAIRTLPRGTLAVLSVASIDEHLAELQQTGLYRLLGELPWGEPMRATIAKLRSDIASETGLSPAQLEALLRRGLSVALTGIDADGRPAVIAVAPLGDDAAAWRNAFVHLQKTGRLGSAHVRAELHGGVPILTLQEAAGARLVMCVHEGHLLAGYDTRDVEACLERLENSGSSLADDPVFAEFAARTAGEPEPLVSFFAQPAAILQAVMPMLASESAEKVRAVLKGLRLDTMHGIGWLTHARDGRFHDIARLHFPAPRQGLLAALLGPGQPLRPEVASLVPPDASGFAVMQLGLDRLFEEAINLTRAVEPQAPRMVSASLASLRSRTGVDLEQDVLAILGTQIVSVGWPAEDNLHTHAAVLVEVRDAWRVEQALTRLLKSLRVPLSDRPVSGRKVYDLAMPGGALPVQPSFAFTNSQFVFATSERAMQSTLAQIASGTPNARVQTLLAAQPAGTTWLSQSDFGETARALLRQARAAMPPTAPGQTLEVLDRLQRGLALAGGSVETTMAMDDGGITLRTHSPVGNVWAIGGVAVVAAIAIPNLLKAKQAAERAAATQRDGGDRSAARTRTPATDRERYEAIVAAEQQRGGRIPAVVIEGLSSANVLVARRAAYAAGVLRAAEAVPQLCRLTTHDDVEVQRQAMAALAAIGDARSLQAAIAGLQNDELEVRQFAIATLARLRDRASINDLVLHLDSDAATEAEQLQATLALADIGDPQALLRAATVITTDGKRPDEALAYLFQTLSPKLAPDDESKVLMAVLDHASRLVRRYAIQRLGQLRSPAAVPALEGRLAQETDSLRPLVLVSLDAIRGETNRGGDTFDRIRETAGNLWNQTREHAGPFVAKVRETWNQLPRNQQLAIGGGGVGALAILLALNAWRRRRRRRAAQIQQLSSSIAGATEWDTRGHADDAMDVDDAPWIEDDDSAHADPQVYEHNAR